MKQIDYDHQTSAAVAATLASELATAATSKFVEQNGLPFLRTVTGESLSAQEQLLPAPVRLRGHQALYTLKDLHAFIANQKTEGARTVIFANRANLTITAVLDYHQPGQARWLDHRASVTYTLSRQLKLWTGAAGKKLTQEEFALFLDENIEDISSPAGADVLTFAQTLEATRTQTFKSTIKATTGECHLQYSSQADGEQKTKLIEEIELGIPLWERGVAVVVPVKIFHRISSEGKLTFWFTLKNLDRIMDKVWEQDLEFLRTTVSAFATLYEGPAPAEVAPLSL